MRISTFFYTIKQGLKNIWKNKMFSLASIATMTACIFLFGLFYTIVTNFQSMVKDAESGVAVTVFFDEGISQDKIDEIGDLIRARAEVSNLEFVSADDAWDSFKQTYFEGNEAAAESFAGDNPLANDASYPACKRSLYSRAWERFCVQTLAVKPYSVSFASCNASSPSATRTRFTTGPNTSSRVKRNLASGFTTSVGAT